MENISPKYVIDTCSLTAMRRIYPIDVFPSAWDKLNELARLKNIVAPEDVFEEIKIQDDGILDWALQNRHIFIPLDAAIQIEAGKILSTHENLLDLRKKKSGADPFVVATAIVHSSTVVTEEKPSGGPERSKIPDVCNAYKIDCISLLEMFRREGLRI